MIPDDPRIHVVRRAHTGHVGTARQEGLERSSGQYVVFQDSDDRSSADRLQRQVLALERTPEAGWCHGDYVMIDESGGTIPRRAGRPWQPRTGDVLHEILTTEASIALQTMLIRRELAQAIGFDRRMAFGDDYDFTIRLAARAPACAVSGVVAEFREHAGRASHVRCDQSLDMALAYWKCRGTLRDPALRRVCRQRAWSLFRHYAARARRSVGVVEGLRQVRARLRRA